MSIRRGVGGEGLSGIAGSDLALNKEPIFPTQNVPTREAALLIHDCRKSLVALLLLAAGAPAAARNLPPRGVMAADPVPVQAAAVLTGVCMKCHNAAMKAGGIDFTTRSTAARAFGSGDPSTSPLLLAVSQGRMPPTGKLPAAQITLLSRWMAGGALYPRPRLDQTAPPARKPLWSLQPIRHPPIPHTRLDTLAQNPIDRFIFARLLARGLHPSRPASPLALIRRVTVDLTGLPPTPEEVTAFLQDQSPCAYEKVVDRLLASPAYGERWGRHWLDVVRFGESSGYEQNHLRADAWPYRDYVIHAFNEDKPYTQFIREQIAGDALAAQDPEAQAATGFLVAGIHDTVGISTEEGTRQQRANDLDDIVSTTGAAFLGLTVGCARCHDHKFDPIPQKDYYRLSAVFAGVRHGERPVAITPQQVREIHAGEEINQRIAGKTADLKVLQDRARAAILRARTGPTSRPAVNPLRNVDDFPSTPARFVRFTILSTNDGAEPCLDELQVFGQNSSLNLALQSAGSRATASSLLPGYAIHQVDHLNDGLLGNAHSWISNTRGTGWAQIQLPRPQVIRRVIWSRDGGENASLDDRLPVRYRIEVSLDGMAWQTVATEAGRSPYPGSISSDELQAALSAPDRQQCKALSGELSSLQQRAAQIQSDTMAYVGQFTAPDPTYLLRRGDVMQRLEPVTPGALSQITALNPNLIANPAAPEPARRLALARWITDARNPLTARVMVNRIWQYHFGRGLVGTSSDFGNNGEKPTHPDLLDWLAATFRDSGFCIKPLQKMMVMSYVYRQASGGDAHSQAIDAANQLLWRMPLRRLEAEAVRDAILCASGKLNRTIGGPSFRLFQYSVVNVAIYGPLPADAYGPETWRRSVYQQAARGIQDNLLGKFDCPESSQRAPTRDDTTTPLQALALLNSSFVVQQAGFFADRVRQEAGPRPADQVNRAFQIAFGRLPLAAELRDSTALLSHLGLPALCRALMNANEFLYY